jgi:hypothetical protein
VDSYLNKIKEESVELENNKMNLDEENSLDDLSYPEDLLGLTSNNMNKI